MNISHKVTLSLDQRGDRQIIDAVQGDTARTLEISLLENGQAWTIPEGTMATIHYRRVNSGVGGSYDTMPDGTEAYSIDGNVVTIRIAQLILTLPGQVEMQVTLTNGGEEITCFSIWFSVQGNLMWTPKDDESYVNLEENIRLVVEKMNLGASGGSVHYIAGDTNSTSGIWRGTCEAITQYYEGLMVAYKPVISGGSVSTTLNINDLGAVPIKRNGMNHDVTYYYQANSVLFLTYVVVNGAGYWQLTDMWWADTDRKTSAVSCQGEKLYLLGAKNISSSGLTSYANSNCYIGADNCLYSGGTKVAKQTDIPTVPEALPNPNALTINGQVYDGSQAVQMTVAAEDAVADYVRTEAQRLAALVQSRQNANTISFMLGSDIHARVDMGTTSDQMLESTRHAAQAMELIRKQVHLDFVGLLGDYLWDGDAASGSNETAEQAMQMYRIIHEYFSPAFSGLPQFWAKGNHDMLDDEDHVSQLTDEQIFSAIGIHNAGATFNSADRVQGYCHRDFEEFKLRVVCMNTSKSYSTAVDTPQINWLKTVLDVESGWKVILLSHIPMDWWGIGSTVYSTVSAFADKILCHIHGHTHNYVTGFVGNTTIPRIAIPNIDFYRANTYAGNATFGEDTTYTKTADSAMDTAFCVITVDLAKNKLYADHYGSGYDRETDLNTGETTGGNEGGGESGYTNVIKTAVANDGTAYNGGTGYKADTRINSSDVDVACTGMCCTGNIPVSGTDVVRIKNMTVSGSNTSYFVLKGSLTASHATGSISGASGFPAPDANGVITFNIAELNPDAKYIRLSVGVIDDTSIITINEPIV